MLEEFMRETVPIDHDGLGVVIGAFSLKGGVGKSTTCDALGSYLDESVVFNLDIAQRASEINACPTVDYSDIMSKKTVEDAINELRKKYRYVIIDTPGEITEQVIQALPFIKHYIIPMTIGKRSRSGIESTLNGFFANDDLDISGEIKIVFLINAYKNIKKRDIAVDHFKKMFKEFKSTSNVKIVPKLTALDYSDTISSAEEIGESVVSLAKENPGAYNTAMKKLNTVCRVIEDHFEL
jgi:cellulose biosynthesis protein BcsQ